MFDRKPLAQQKASDYFENTKSAIAIHREYGERNPYGFKGYSRDFWGITAGDGPTAPELRENGRDRRFFGYMSRGLPYGPDDGTIAPWAMLATLPFAPEAALAGTRLLLELHPQVCHQDRFSSGFNPTLQGSSGPWLSEGWYGLDQGLLAMTTGEAHDNRLVITLLSALKSGAMLLADRGFDADWIRTFVSEHGAWENIPPRRNRTEPICFSLYLYRARNLVERFFNKIKQCRRVATRYDKLAANYLAFIQLASIRLWLRVNECAP